MKKALLLSLLIPVAFTGTHSQAALFGTADKMVAGAVAGLAAVGLGKCAYSAIKGPRANVATPQFEGSFGLLLGGASAVAATLSAILLNPTSAPSSLIATSGIGLSFATLSLIAISKDDEVADRPKNSAIEERIDANLQEEIQMSAACAAVIASISVLAGFSHLNK